MLCVLSLPWAPSGLLRRPSWPGPRAPAPVVTLSLSSTVPSLLPAMAGRGGGSLRVCRSRSGQHSPRVGGSSCSGTHYRPSRSGQHSPRVGGSSCSGTHYRPPPRPTSDQRFSCQGGQGGGFSEPAGAGLASVAPTGAGSRATAPLSALLLVPRRPSRFPAIRGAGTDSNSPLLASNEAAVGLCDNTGWGFVITQHKYHPRHCLLRPL